MREATTLALADLPPDTMVARLQASGLRGRGGGWFPAARKWRAVRAEPGDAAAIANGAEGEPGSVKDRYLMLHRPAEVLAGLRLAARAVAAREAVVYLKGSFGRAAHALESALRAGPSAPGVQISVHLGADTYVAGEETAVLEALEGRRAWPRPKPPLPAAVGLHGRPTLVHNVETLARVPDALGDPDGFRTSEKTFVSLWGHVRRPGVYEVTLGTPLRQLVEEQGQGAPGGISMVFPAGPSAPPLSGPLLDTPLDPDALRAAGSGLGTASVLVVGAAVCPVAVAVSLADFFARESCGQCPPCTVGAATLARIVHALEEGGRRGRDLHDLAEVCGFMSDHGYCAHSRTAAASVQGLLRRFPREVEAHRAAGCPSPGERADLFAPDAPERAAIEACVA